MAKEPVKKVSDPLLDALEPENLSPDELMALVLLNGTPGEDNKGLPIIDYLADSAEEHARYKLANLLRSNRPLHPRIRSALADLIDPTPTESENSLARIFSALPKAEQGSTVRKIVFKNRKQGQPPPDEKHLVIARFVHNQVMSGTKKEAAVQLAREKFDVARTTVTTAYRAPLTIRF